MEISDINNPELRNLISKLPEGRLKDYYRDFVIHHENVILNFKINNYDDMPMREAVMALCKALFHEVYGAEANAYYKKNGVNKGNRFTLSDINSPNCEVFYFNRGGANKKIKSSISKEQGDFLPNGELLQIATAVASKKGFNQFDSRYGRFKAVHDTVHAYTSNDRHHVSADMDKSKLTLSGRISDYESFVFGILSDFAEDFTLPLLDYISSATNSDYNKLKEEDAERQLIVSETTRTLIERLNDVIDSEYLNPLVLFLPTNVDAVLISALSRIPWNLIVTFDPDVEKDKEGHVVSVLKKQWDGIRPFKIDDVTSDGREETGIILAQVNSPANEESTIKKRIKLSKNKISRALLKIRKGSEGICAVCIPDKDDDQLFNNAGVGSLSEEDTLIIVGNAGSNLKKGIDEYFSIDEDKCEKFDIPLSQAIYAFYEVSVPLCKDVTLSSHTLSQEDISRYASYGIKVISPIPAGTEKARHPISDFFCGKDITERDLYNDFDVKRSEYENLRKVIEERLKNGTRFTHYLKQTPTCGATTLAMRLAYDMAILNTKTDLNSPVTSIFISEFKTEDANNIIGRIKDLALKVSPNQILAFIDRSIQEKDFDRVKQTLTDGG
ncbi:MAG: hypothetical protein K2K97_02970, partial [Muribaculaceae bacterium]|nr:hypothetical protein [Muribaculaceae bacterium]